MACTIPITSEGLAKLSHRTNPHYQPTNLDYLANDSENTENCEDFSLISDIKKDLYLLAQFVSNNIAIYFR